MKHKRQHNQKPLHVEVFSLAEIRLAQDAVKQFEGWLSQCTDVTTKRACAEETVILVKGKLAMLQTARNYPMTFEYNDHIVLLAAIQAYMVSLSACPPTPRRAEQFRQCEHIKAFALLALEAVQANPTQD